MQIYDSRLSRRKIPAYGISMIKLNRYESRTNAPKLTQCASHHVTSFIGSLLDTATKDINAADIHGIVAKAMSE